MHSYLTSAVSYFVGTFQRSPTQTDQFEREKSYLKYAGKSSLCSETWEKVSLGCTTSGSSDLSRSVCFLCLLNACFHTWKEVNRMRLGKTMLSFRIVCVLVTITLIAFKSEADTSWKSRLRRHISSCITNTLIYGLSRSYSGITLLAIILNTCITSREKYWWCVLYGLFFKFHENTQNILRSWACRHECGYVTKSNPMQPHVGLQYSVPVWGAQLFYILDLPASLA